MDRRLQEFVRQRAGNRCEYCQVHQAHDRIPFEIDHVIAQVHSGLTKANNLCLCCFACNRHKGPNISGIDPVSGRIVPLYHPRCQKWLRHFRWDGAKLMGLTPRGRATVIVLRINLDHRVGLRRELIKEGVFPPE